MPPRVGETEVVALDRISLEPRSQHINSSDSHNDVSTEDLKIERHFGSKYKTETHVLGYANLLPQMRPSLIEEDQEDLKNSIRKEGMLNQPIYAVMDEVHAQEYINIINKTWNKKLTINDLRPKPNGDYVIVTAGHRRSAAAIAICKEDGSILDNTTIDAQTVHNPSPYAVLNLQLAENVFVPPRPERYAQIIYESFMLGRASGVYNSVADFQRQMPMGETMVSNALRYMQLPQGIRKEVDDGNLPYSHANETARIIKPYKKFLAEETEFIKPSYSTEEMVEERLWLILNERAEEKWSHKKLNAFISGLIDSWQEKKESAEAMFEQSAAEQAAELEQADFKKIMGRMLLARGHVVHATDIVRTTPEYAKKLTTEERLKVCKELAKLEALAKQVQIEMCQAS